MAKGFFCEVNDSYREIRLENFQGQAQAEMHLEAFSAFYLWATFPLEHLFTSFFRLMPTLLTVLSALPLLSKSNMATTHWKIYWKPRKRDFRFNIKQKLKFKYIPLAADHMPLSPMSALLLSAVTVVSDTVDSVVGTEATGSPLGNKRHIFLLQY